VDMGGYMAWIDDGVKTSIHQSGKTLNLETSIGLAGQSCKAHQERRTHTRGHVGKRMRDS
jgi:hypothetical protein